MRIRDEPYPPLPDQQEDLVLQLSSSSLPLHDIIMQAPTAERQHQDLTMFAAAVAEGVEGEPSILPLAGEGSRDMAQDIIIAVVALGVEEASSTLPDLLGTPGLLTQ